MRERQTKREAHIEIDRQTDVRERNSERKREQKRQTNMKIEEN